MAKKPVKKTVEKKAVKKVAKKVVKRVPKKVAKSVKTATPKKSGSVRKVKLLRDPKFVVIAIKGLKANRIDLELDPAEPSVNVGDTVIWVNIAQNEVLEIVDIFQADTKSPKLFPKSPEPLPDRYAVAVQITGAYKKMDDREYTIRYTPTSNPLTIVTVDSDPKIIVNP